MLFPSLYKSTQQLLMNFFHSILRGVFDGFIVGLIGSLVAIVVILFWWVNETDPSVAICYALYFIVALVYPIVISIVLFVIVYVVCSVIKHCFKLNKIHKIK